MEASQENVAQGEQDTAVDEAVDDLIGDDDLDASEEARRMPKGLKRAYTPSAQEILEHNRTHTPYRNWCKHCVAGRGPNLPHRRAPQGHGVSKNEISADYCFLRDVQGGPSQVVLVGRDRRTGHTSHMLCHTREPAWNGWRSKWFGTSQNAGTMGAWC